MAPLNLRSTSTVLLLLLLAACGDSGKHSVTTSEQGAALSRSIPFPDDREASALTEYVLPGSAADLNSTGAVPSGTTMVLSAEAGGYEYALYRFNPGEQGAGKLVSVNVLLEETSTGGAWIGLADFKTRRWVHSGPYVEQATLAVDDPRYTSLHGKNLWVAVIVAAQERATVNSVRVQTDQPDWVKVTIDDSTFGSHFGRVGEQSSLAIVDGRPAIAYYYAHIDHQNLMYVYSNSADGTGDWTKVSVDSDGSKGSPSLAVVNGKPAISYTRRGDLMYAYSSTVDGSGGWNSVEVDSTSWMSSTSLAIVSGKPAISYLDETNDTVRYAYSSSIDGSNGWTTLTVDSTEKVTYKPSLAVIDGRPAIAYYDLNTLKYAHSSVQDGSSGWTTEALGVGGGFPSLAEVNGRPAIAIPGGNGLWYYYSYPFPEGSAWIQTKVAPVGGHCSLAFIDGRPAIATSSLTGLRYVCGDDVLGFGDWVTVTADNSYKVGGWYPTLAVVDGRPAISYFNLNLRQLEYVVMAE